MQLPGSRDEWTGLGVAIAGIAGVLGAAIAAYRSGFTKKAASHDALRLQRDTNTTDTAGHTLETVSWLVTQMQETIESRTTEIADLKQELTDFKRACAAEIAALKAQVIALQQEISRLRRRASTP